MPGVTFLSDYGLTDDFVGVCHGVIARIAPDVRVVDMTHGIARHDVRSGAIVLRRALDYMPAGVHLAVVDPGVGSDRRAVALRCGERLLVGPDNGLLWLAAQQLGGVADAVDIGASPLGSVPVSASFHGRDLFAPIAAHLASGATLDQAGEPLDPSTLATLELPRAEPGDGRLRDARSRAGKGRQPGHYTGLPKCPRGFFYAVLRPPPASMDRPLSGCSAQSSRRDRSRRTTSGSSRPSSSQPGSSRCSSISPSRSR